VCERPWRDPSAVSVGVATCIATAWMRTVDFGLKVMHIYEQSKIFRLLTCYVELK